MKTKTITYYADPGHAWAKVKRQDLIKLGIINLISAYSYESKDFVYLEEDCDLTLYVQALKSQGIEPKFKGNQSNKQSKIRGYSRFTLRHNEKYQDNTLNIINNTTRE